MVLNIIHIKQKIAKNYKKKKEQTNDNLKKKAENFSHFGQKQQKN